MEKRRLGRTGFEVSALGFGGGPVGFLGTDQDRVTNIVNYLLDNGVNFIDTAAGYPGSEEALGNAVSHRRDEYVLVSKCGQAFDDLEGEAWSAQVIEQTVDRALRRLKTDRLDVMLLHGCDQEFLERGEAVEALVKARDAGKIRHAGYSGDNEAGLYAAGLDAIDVIETSVNICDQANIDSLLPEAKRRDIGVIVKRPVANAAWLGVGQQPGFYANYTTSYAERFGAMGLDPADLGGGDWAEIALRFTLAQDGVTTAIVGTTNPDNAKRNIEVAEKGPLPDAAIATIRSAFAEAESASGEAWLGLR
ncbi:MAG: aldo/keto reductase [Rhodospirillaceae bacterium]|nr:aldo/keto reductase [Rhodospirillaceae bacterium]MDD9916241.1 aldo/keto reductase [Rhodospirillaceae bacterium]MDD9926077.1 aldo/keto reductase [Rhodospirillaceae bacterium]